MSFCTPATWSSLADPSLPRWNLNSLGSVLTSSQSCRASQSPGHQSDHHRNGFGPYPRPYRHKWAARFCRSPRSLNPQTRQAGSYSKLVADAPTRAIDDRRRRGMLHACRTCCCGRVPAVGGHPPPDPGRCIGRSLASRCCTTRRAPPGAPCGPSYNSAWSRHDVPFLPSGDASDAVF